MVEEDSRPISGTLGWLRKSVSWIGSMTVIFLLYLEMPQLLRHGPLMKVSLSRSSVPSLAKEPHQANHFYDQRTIFMNTSLLFGVCHWARCSTSKNWLHVAKNWANGPSSFRVRRLMYLVCPPTSIVLNILLKMAVLTFKNRWREFTRQRSSYSVVLPCSAWRIEFKMYLLISHQRLVIHCWCSC
jgi:hypothetical protein